VSLKKCLQSCQGSCADNVHIALTCPARLVTVTIAAACSVPLATFGENLDACDRKTSVDADCLRTCCELPANWALSMQARHAQVRQQRPNSSLTPEGSFERSSYRQRPCSKGQDLPNVCSSPVVGLTKPCVQRALGKARRPATVPLFSARPFDVCSVKRACS
jgi:hypothetical protein